MSKPLWTYTIDELDFKLRLANEDGLRLILSFLIHWLQRQIKKEEEYRIEKERELIRNRHMENTVYFSNGKVANGSFVPEKQKKLLDEQALNECVIIL